MSLTSVIIAAEQPTGPGVSPWLIGGGAFVLLVLLMVGLLAFGGGRDHS